MSETLGVFIDDMDPAITYTGNRIAERQRRLHRELWARILEHHSLYQRNVQLFVHILW